MHLTCMYMIDHNSKEQLKSWNYLVAIVSWIYELRSWVQVKLLANKYTDNKLFAWQDIIVFFLYLKTKILSVKHIISDSIKKKIVIDTHYVIHHCWIRKLNYSQVSTVTLSLSPTFHVMGMNWNGIVHVIRSFNIIFPACYFLMIEPKKNHYSKSWLVLQTSMYIYYHYRLRLVLGLLRDFW